MATNKFPGTCTKCGSTVPAGEGTLTRGTSGWQVAHEDGICNQVDLITIYDFTPSLHNGGAFLHHGQPVVVVKTKRVRSQDDEDEWDIIAIARPATEEEAASLRAEEDHRIRLQEAERAAASLIAGEEEVSLSQFAERIGGVRSIGFWEPVDFYADAHGVYASYSRYDNDAFGSRVTSLPRTAELEEAIQYLCERRV